MKFSKKIVQQLVQEQKSEFMERGDCEECDDYDTAVKLMYGWSGSGIKGEEGYRVNEHYVCYACYKKKMKIFADHRDNDYCLKSFRPEWVWNETEKEWINGDEL